ncbi:MAG: hypothetical protein AAGA58_07465 [Verrucomicrobiota bacterium]
MIEFANFFEKLGDPQFLQLLLEPLSIYGVLFGLVGFVFAFLFKERKTQLAALMLIIVSALSVIPYTQFRKKADMESAAFAKSEMVLVEEHHTRLLENQWIYFAVAGLASLTLLMGAHKGTPGLLMGGATAIVGVGAVFFSMWLYLKSESINNPELRYSESEVAKADNENIVRPLNRVAGNTGQ